MAYSSSSVLIVYSLLVIDLIVNMADTVQSTDEPGRAYRFQEHLGINDNKAGTFSVMIVQTAAVFLVVVFLVLYFLEVAHLLTRSTWLRPKPSGRKRSSETARARLAGTPLALRYSLSLVLQRYWWSLLVGLVYLVLTIMLQIVRLDPSWHPRAQPEAAATATAPPERMEGAPASIVESRLRLGVDELRLVELGAQVEELGLAERQADQQAQGRLGRASSTDDSEGAGGPGGAQLSYLPVVLLLAHKLMSTCYYVSFVVVFRASPELMVMRILANKAPPTNRNLPAAHG